MFPVFAPQVFDGWDASIFCQVFLVWWFGGLRGVEASRLSRGEGTSFFIALVA